MNNNLIDVEAALKDTLHDLDTIQPESAAPIPGPVRVASARKRHHFLLLSFILCVLLPTSSAGWYLWHRAADQYVSRLGFAVRAQETVNAFDVFDGLGNVTTGNTDTDILYEFIQSQELVELIDARIDLRSMFGKPSGDPIFSFVQDAPIEALVDYWRRMVSIFYDSGTTLIELEIRAFSPDDAVLIADEILSLSSVMINRLTKIAREDTTRYAQSELNTAVERLKIARQALTQFRSTTQIVDPSADVQGQMTVLVSLQQQLAKTYVELDLLVQTSRENGPRVTNLRREVEVIEKRIEIERQKFGLGGDKKNGYTALLARFEELNVDLEFAQTSYLSALQSYDIAKREAQQKSRYLAPYLNPTRPESAEFPQRITLLALIALFSFLIWAVLSLVYYSARDRG